jgi:hypothetical protein
MKNDAYWRIMQDQDIKVAATLPLAIWWKVGGYITLCVTWPCRPIAKAKVMLQQSLLNQLQMGLQRPNLTAAIHVTDIFG